MDLFDKNNNLVGNIDFKEFSGRTLSDEEKYQQNKLNESFVRWQEKQVNWHTFIINLIITFSIGILYFIADKKTSVCVANLVVLYMIMFSLLFGFAALLTRLLDFRLTKETCKYKKYKFCIEHTIKNKKADKYTIENIDSKIDALRAKTDCLGDSTWILFYIQFGLFIGAGLILIVSLSTFQIIALYL